MTPEKLTRMANQIAAFFATQPPYGTGDAITTAAERTAQHLRKFWEPEMRAALIAHAETGATDLGPVAQAAARLLQQPPAGD